MSLRDDLIAAKALIDTPEKWIRGDFERDGCFCILGAISRATTGGSDFSREHERSRAAQEALEGALRGSWKGYRLEQYNDYHTIKHRHVTALFDRAIAAAEDTP